MLMFIIGITLAVEGLFQHLLGFSFLHWSFGFLLRRLEINQRFNPFPRTLWLLENRPTNGAPQRVQPAPQQGKCNISSCQHNWKYYNNVPRNILPVVPQKPIKKQTQKTFAHKKITQSSLEPAELCEMSPEALLVLLSCKSEQLMDYLNSETNVYLFVRCLYILSTAQFDAAKSKLFQIVCNSNFMTALEEYVANTPSNTINTSWIRFYQELLRFMESVIDVCPKVGIHAFKRLFELLSYKELTFSTELAYIFTEIQGKYLTSVEEQYHGSELKRFSGTPTDDEDTPFLKSFRDVGILPKRDDLFFKRAFLRPNIVEGAYDSVEDYLEVQFHLMREDFLAPLRETVAEYNFSRIKNQYSGARIYKNAKLHSYALEDGVLVVKLWYGDYIAKDPAFTSDDEEDKTKRFMFGSLLCLTCDHFATVLFCLVYDTENLKSGKISVVEVTGKPISDEMFNETYLLVESETYFAPYHHVLRALQSPSLPNNFPFADYIVHVKDSEAPPQYLRNFSEYEVFKGNKVKLDSSMSLSWSEESGLDQTQYQAYIKALFRKFVIIQGPPGTGKTHIGLKIASAILQNCYLNRNDFKPILVVCYTNHALDQFLEGLLNVTNKLVRVGGQSKNENLEEYNLKSLRKPSVEKGQIKKSLWDNSRHLETFLKIFDSFQSLDHFFDLEQNNICFKFPYQVNIERTWNLPIHLESFLSKFSNGKRPKLLNWLLLSDCGIDERLSFDFNKYLPRPIDEVLNDSDDSYFESPMTSNGTYHFTSCDISKMQFSHERISFEIRVLQRSKLNESSPNLGIQNEIAACQWDLEYLKMRLSRGNFSYSKVDFCTDKDARSYSPEERWSLYWEWLEFVKTDLMQQFGQAVKINQTEKIIYDELCQAIDLNILKDKHVIGMTTTSAARLHSLLRALRSPIVIVEEAAEVMESHVVVSLTKDCQHLIMIGDHQQLRPITATHKMGMEYNLDVSLFERMVINGTHCHQLGVQHRMRPEIARLITPAIYKNLKNHSNVEEYPSVMGVRKNLFFIDHKVPETKNKRSTSHMNDHEARFILRLANYFVHQGYDPEEITILSTYTEQTLHMCSLRADLPELEAVKICNLDGFQGRENRIILLSLVRSNPQGRIGFLATDNRVCVALSRAREGFYIIGNMNILKGKSSLWDSVNKTLTELDSIGPKLTLRCQLHPKTITLVKTEKDFKNVPVGGCRKICRFRMSCGHDCQIYCHPADRLHQKILCQEKCQRSVCGHGCPLRCHEECQPCGELVTRSLPCGHEADMECHEDHLQHKCTFIFAEESPVCHHQITRFCHENLENVLCEEPCMEKLECEHACALNCHKESPLCIQHVCSECSGLRKFLDPSNKQIENP